MGGAHSREDLEISDSESEEEENYQDVVEEEENGERSSERRTKTPSSLDEVEAKLRALKLKYPSQHHPILPNAVKLYLYIGGNTPKAKWVTSEKLTSYSFLKTCGNGGSDDDEQDDEEGGESWWILKVGSKVRAKVALEMQLKTFGDQCRVDFVSQGVWAMKFFSEDEYRNFVEVADDSVWEDAEDGYLKSPDPATPARASQDLREEFEEAANGGGIQSLALGALDNSFLVNDSGIQVVKNFSHGIQGKGVFVNFDNGNRRGGFGLEHSTPKKALLMRAETNMLLMSPMTEGKPHTRGLHHLDIETGKIVTEWKFEKDGTDITMRDITNDSKGAQMDPSGSTFLGLDDNRLCRWDMRDRNGMVQNLSDASTPVLHWTQGHQFSRGTNFQCFATAGDGSIVWILGTTDTYLILISTLFIDKEGRTKTGFAGRMGNRISAPRLLKLTPLDSHLAGVNNKFRGAQFSWETSLHLLSFVKVGFVRSRKLELSNDARVTENGKQERHLVATVGKFSVIWNFQQVKNGSHECYHNQEGLKSCYCYKIVLKDDSIVDSRFMHDKFAVSDSPEAPLVVATHMKWLLNVKWNIGGQNDDFSWTAAESVFGQIQSSKSKGSKSCCQREKKMAITVGTGFLVQPSSSLSLLGRKSCRPTLDVAYRFLPARPGPSRFSHGTVVQAQQRPTWLPGLDPPPYLNGTLAGDFGFDPLGLGEDPENLRWYVQAELVHARFAMAGVAGILVTDLLRVTGISNLPVWYEAGAVKFEFASTEALFIVQLILMGFVETKRYMDFTNPGSQAKEGSFFGLEAALEGLEPGYPGGPLLNPLGLARDIKNAHDWKLKEIKNGRLAMVAMLGIFVQASVTHAGPIENLVEHLSNPWHKTIIQTISSTS
ncbi:Protein CYPRO4 [Vitis vinifera]|uniref:Protein CYPRO4 n=1 Tax=Vitis vinifera TaxID=29760 RepID=A0A438DYD3_VITVI|nr:Protein CYPRO4 [Vitis vinifera]